MKNKFISYLMFFVMISLIASMLLLNVYGVSEDSIDIGDYNHSFSFSASYNPNITLYSITSDNSITLQTTEGTSFNAFKDERTMTDDDINDCNNEIMSGDYEITDDDIEGDPSYSYNCHSYAWYDRTTSNEYWINLPDQFIDDVHCSDELTESQLQPDDIVTYWRYGWYVDNDNNLCYGYYCAHSAVVESIENGTIVCVSKWGQYGLYRHDIDKVHDAYKNNGEPDTKFYRYIQDEHFLSIDEDNGESGHKFICTAEKEDEYGDIQTCSYTTECDGEFTVTSVNSSYHRIYCSNCYYSEYVDHDLYMYSAAPEDYVVKCHDCTYIVECWESPEYYGNSNDGHWVDCPCGCYSFFEPHTPGSYSSTEEGYHNVVCADCGYVYSEDCNYGSSTSSSNSSYHFFECTDCGYERAEAHLFTYSQIANNVYSHNAYCRICKATYSKPHNWVSVSGGYRCSDCSMSTSIIPDYSSLSNEELELLLSSMSEEELEAFIALLPEDDLARVTAILPPDDDEFLTE